MQLFLGKTHILRSTYCANLIKSETLDDVAFEGFEIEMIAVEIAGRVLDFL